MRHEIPYGPASIPTTVIMVKNALSLSASYLMMLKKVFLKVLKLNHPNNFKFFFSFRKL